MDTKIEPMYKFSKRSLDRLEGVKPILIAIFVEAIKDCPIDFGIPRHGGLRTADEQNLLYKEKVSKRDGYRRKSYHQSGRAIDIYAYVNGKASWDKDHLTIISDHIKMIAHSRYGIKIKWGGDWKVFIDMPHFQI